MPLSIKNNYCFVILCLIAMGCNNQTVSNGNNTTIVKQDTIIPLSQKTYTILLSGFPPPILYNNAQDIIAKEYNLKFIYAGGCIINENLGDSISEFNESTFYELTKIYRKDMSELIYNKTESEYIYLNKLDSNLKQSAELKKYDFFKQANIYFTKKPSRYSAYFIVPETEKTISGLNSRGLKYKLKLIALIDSANKSIIKVHIKDSLISTNFSNLQHD